MRTISKLVRPACAGAISMLLLLPPAEAEAQWGQRVGIGYVVNAPNQYVGLSAHVLTNVMGGLGLYVDGKITKPAGPDKENFDPTLTAREVDDTLGDVPFADQHDYTSFNAALMRPITPELLFYAGAGYTERRVYVEYMDERQEMGTGGFYWVEDTEAAAQGVNVLFGAFFRIGRHMSLQFGAETQPRGATVGASYSIPFGR